MKALFNYAQKRIRRIHKPRLHLPSHRIPPILTSLTVWNVCLSSPCLVVFATARRVYPEGAFKALALIGTCRVCYGRPDEQALIDAERRHRSSLAARARGLPPTGLDWGPRRCALLKIEALSRNLCRNHSFGRTSTKPVKS